MHRLNVIVEVVTTLKMMPVDEAVTVFSARRSTPTAS
jgi:hypothetical protein